MAKLNESRSRCRSCSKDWAMQHDVSSGEIFYVQEILLEENLAAVKMSLVKDDISASGWVKLISIYENDDEMYKSDA